MGSILILDSMFNVASKEIKEIQEVISCLGHDTKEEKNRQKLSTVMCC